LAETEVIVDDGFVEIAGVDVGAGVGMDVGVDGMVEEDKAVVWDAEDGVNKSDWVGLA
jgi:hypothetical protein